jgi:hypothetical protein
LAHQKKKKKEEKPWKIPQNKSSYEKMWSFSFGRGIKVKRAKLGANHMG